MRRSWVAVVLAAVVLVPGCFFGWEWDGPCDPSRDGAVDCSVAGVCPKGSLCIKCRCHRPKDLEVLVKAGTFTMGSPASEPGRDSDETQHQVTLTHSFAIWKYEITQGEFESLVGYNPSHFSSCGKDCPVEEVSWHEAVAYCNALSKQAGLLQCFDCQGSKSSATCSLKSAYTGNGGKDYYKCPGYRLPTEAEWEYAARAGSTGATYGALDDIAWNDGNSGNKTHAVGGKKANAWGLHDMIGNVWEWTYDWHGSYPSGAVTDPVGPSSGSNRVYRGGSWSSYARYCRAAYRNGNGPSYRNSYLGFRPSRSAP